MKMHKYDSLVKFIKLEGVKEFKDTDPTLFSEDGLSTSTNIVEKGKTAVVTMQDAKNACEKYLENAINLHQLQQWAEWIHIMDFFELSPDGNGPDYDESLIDVITDIDMLDITADKVAKNTVKSILEHIDNWIKMHTN